MEAGQRTAGTLDRTEGAILHADWVRALRLLLCMQVFQQLTQQQDGSSWVWTAALQVIKKENLKGAGDTAAVGIT